ncbi:hypothetical protein H6F46_06890 [Limnothrix sp. FACHB-1083]|uniref:hypothetical protein n=1 Tax=unclassified Limnothrix TaxID=2632864 RepID=UPI0016806404|nr:MULTISPECIES: hypothetical protein [unclassified Limnothrix]MBD2160418.1 hypothetical protein [Limnothrix sp. FACHB-1083]MBD2191119.1 hypothetical protein [Limnothrix sp. FACHB-1088]
MLQSTSLPGALLETATLLSAAEKALATPRDNIQISYNFETFIANVVATLPFTVDLSGTDQVGLVPTDYAPVSGFNAAAVAGLTGGASITSPATALLKIAAAMDVAEKAKVAAGGSIPDGVGIAITGDLENLQLGLAIDVPFQVAVGSGGTQVLTAVNYLA